MSSTARTKRGRDEIKYSCHLQEAQKSQSTLLHYLDWDQTAGRSNKDGGNTIQGDSPKRGLVKKEENSPPDQGEGRVMRLVGKQIETVQQVEQSGIRFYMERRNRQRHKTTGKKLNRVEYKKKGRLPVRRVVRRGSGKGTERREKIVVVKEMVKNS